MRKTFKTAVAALATTAMVASVFAGVSAPVKADGVTLGDWAFIQGGQYNQKEPDNTGYITSVTLDGTNESITGWQRGVNAEQVQKATQASTGFTMVIENTGWDAVWGANPVQFNPWAVRAEMQGVAMEPGHIYTVSFTASASKKKYAYVDFATNVDGTDLAPMDKEPLREGSDKQVIAIGTTDNTYTYSFTNYVSGKELATKIMLGAFSARYDYAGNDVSDVITEEEKNWNGTVYVKNFSVVDNGLDPEFVEIPTDPEPDTPKPEVTTKPQINPPTTTKKPVTTTKKKPAPTTKKIVAPGKVNLTKVTNVKGKKAKLTWKKIKNIKGYQIQYATNKKFTKGKKIVTAKASAKTKTISKLKKGKTYFFRVRAYRMKNKKKLTGKWSKVRRVTIRK